MKKRTGRYKHRDEEVRKKYYADQKEPIALLPPTCNMLRPDSNVYGTILWVDEDGKEAPVICMCGGSMYLDYRCAQNILASQDLIDKLYMCQDALEKALPFLFDSPPTGLIDAHDAVVATLELLKEGDDASGK